MKISILGIGNVLRGDDGIGVYIANYMRKINFPYEATACEGSIDLCMDIILNSNVIVIIDCALLGCLPGTACIVKINEGLSNQLSILQSHNNIFSYPGFWQIIERKKIRGILFGIEPENLSFTDKISFSLRYRIDLYAGMIENEIKKLL